MTEPTPAQLAATAAEAIRQANHATIAPDPSLPPGEIAASVAQLRMMADRLPQLLRQLGDALDSLRTTGALRHDAGGDPAGAALEAIEYLGHASTDAAEMYRHLRAAARQLDHLGEEL